MSQSERKVKINSIHDLPVKHQCQLLSISRSSAYYQSKAPCDQELSLMRHLDVLHLHYPFYGASKPNKAHRINPYLLRDIEINHSNQVWCTDITYLPMARGFAYLVAIMDWHSRKVLIFTLINPRIEQAAYIVFKLITPGLNLVDVNIILTG